MSTRVTNPDGPYAIYDSVTGIAFGRTFHDHNEAADFVDWAAKISGQDVRLLSPGDLAQLRARWEFGTKGEKT